jgi:hypothetical protein
MYILYNIKLVNLYVCKVLYLQSSCYVSQEAPKRDGFGHCGQVDVENCCYCLKQIISVNSWTSS